MSSNLRIGSSLFLVLFLSVALIYMPACSNNYLESFSTKTDDDSLFWAAQSALWTNNYTAAITACTSISAPALAQDKTAQVCAAAYAGRCGYSLNWMITNLPTLIANPPLMLEDLSILVTVQTAQQVSDCEMAESILNGIGTAAVRSQDANMFMTLLNLYEIGVITSNIASNGAGGVTGGFNACTMAAADSQGIGEAFYDMFMSVSAIQTISFVANMYTAVNDMCTALLAIGEDTCNLGNATVGTGAGDFNPANLSVTALKGAMSSIKEGLAFGLNLCGGNQSVATCNCP